MKYSLRVAFLAAAACVASGCITPQAYVDPQYQKASYEAIQRLAQPVPVKVDVQFQRNGQPLPSVDNELRGHVESTLRGSGVFTPTTDPNTPATLSVTGNNIADLAAAGAKGFGTGLTFGGVGTMVDDNYEFLCTYRDAAGQERESTYQHAIHTAIGNTKRPPDLTPTTLADAFRRVVEDVVLNFVMDLQEAGIIPSQ